VAVIFALLFFLPASVKIICERIEALHPLGKFLSR
jgi:hypothetical protein